MKPECAISSSGKHEPMATDDMPHLLRLNFEVDDGFVAQHRISVCRHCRCLYIACEPLHFGKPQSEP